MKKATINIVTVEGVSYPVTEIMPNACKNNKKLSKLSIGANVTKIGRKAFFKCKKLKKITIKANKKLNVQSAAFKKISNGSVIKVKGVKGSAKRKIIRKIQKQTNAYVK